MRTRIAAAAAVVAVALLAVWALRRADGPDHYTGFVEGEERVVRSEVAGRVREVLVAEGARVPAGAVLARLDTADVDARVEAKHREIAMLEADTARTEERLALVEATWGRDLAARQAELGQAVTAATLAERTWARERELVRTGASTAQRADDERARRDQARSALDRARQLVARAEAEERMIPVARHEAAVARGRVALARAQLAELEVTRAKYTILAPATATVVQTQLVWPGELAQPGTPVVALLDPADTFVQLWVPVADVARFTLGRRAEIELDSRPGERIPGEVQFVADTATFTPEKIETRDDRLGQVYRVKVRVLEGGEGLQPGTEGNVWLVGDEAA